MSDDREFLVATKTGPDLVVKGKDLSVSNGAFVITSEVNDRIIAAFPMSEVVSICDKGKTARAE
jgi:hypothetical protein